MKEYGGCLHFEPLVKKGISSGYYDKYTDKKIDVDSGRSAIQCILEMKQFNRIWLPVYNCPLVFKRIFTVSDIEINWYNLNSDFTPHVSEDELRQGDVLLWVNYCGVMFDYIIDEVIRLKEKTAIEVIIDNIPAYFSKPRMDVINIYSCRKFLGVPDGGHIIGNSIKTKELPCYSTFENYLYLLQALESGSNSVYEKYQENEKRFINANIAYGMPVLTNKVLKSLDYGEIITSRKRNFDILHGILGDKNRLKFNTETNTPSTYPYLTSNINLRKKLLDNNIYISRYWKHILTNKLANSFEYDLAEYLIPLPIDQRYTEKDMIKLGELVKDLEKNE